MTGLVAGVDVGGTFTDLVIFDPASGDVRLAKVPTTLPNQSGGVLNAFAEAGADLAGIDLIVHGTTTTTNAVLERHLAKTGLITTDGFRDCPVPHNVRMPMDAWQLHPCKSSTCRPEVRREDGCSGPC